MIDRPPDFADLLKGVFECIAKVHTSNSHIKYLAGFCKNKREFFFPEKCWTLFMSNTRTTFDQRFSTLLYIVHGKLLQTPAVQKGARCQEFILNILPLLQQVWKK